MLDERNQVSFAAVATSIETDAEGRKQAAELLFNTDVTGINLVPPSDTVTATMASAKELRIFSRSVAQVKTEAPGRWIYLMPMISAAGELVCSVTIIRDESFTEPRLVKVSQTTHIQ